MIEELENLTSVTKQARTQVESALSKVNEENEFLKRLSEIPILGSLAAFFQKLSDPRSGPRSENPWLQWTLLGVVLIVISTLAFFLLRGGRSQVEEDAIPQQAIDLPAQENTGSVLQSDTLVAGVSEVQSIPSAQISAIVNADSIPVWVIAAEDRLAPFRVQVDNDLRRPYWLDQGDSSLFHFRSRIVVEEELQVMRIRIGNYEYPAEGLESTSRLVVNRDSLRAFLQQVTF